MCSIGDSQYYRCSPHVNDRVNEFIVSDCEEAPELTQPDQKTNLLFAVCFRLTEEETNERTNERTSRARADCRFPRETGQRGGGGNLRRTSAAITILENLIPISLPLSLSLSLLVENARGAARRIANEFLWATISRAIPV